MNHNWRTALLVQARSDYKMFQRLCNTPDSEHCHCLHYLLMATEKLAKGVLSDGANPPKFTHEFFAKMVGEAERHERLFNASGFARLEDFRDFLKGFSKFADEFQKLVPGKEGSINPEYPWEKRFLEDGSIRVSVAIPSEYHWEDWLFHLEKMVQLLGFVRACFIAVEEELAAVCNQA